MLLFVDGAAGFGLDSEDPGLFSDPKIPGLRLSNPRISGLIKMFAYLMILHFHCNFFSNLHVESLRCIMFLSALLNFFRYDARNFRGAA